MNKKKAVEMKSTSQKNEFWSKIFLKNSKSTIPPPPWFSPKNTTMPTENGQTVQFQALKHLLLSAAPWKTTKKTYIYINNSTNLKKQPQNGVFF